MMQVVDLKGFICILCWLRVPRSVPRNLPIQRMAARVIVCLFLLGAFNKGLLLAGLSPEVHSLSPSYTGTSPDSRAISPDVDIRVSPSSTGAVDFERLANAIYKAEGGTKASRPYGILTSYCTKKNLAQCRKGCLQTIAKRYRMWLETKPATRDSKTFISYLSRSYAPLNAKNDPSNLNRHWISNVRWFYATSISNKTVGAHG